MRLAIRVNSQDMNLEIGSTNKGTITTINITLELLLKLLG